MADESSTTTKCVGEEGNQREATYNESIDGQQDVKKNLQDDDNNFLFVAKKPSDVAENESSEEEEASDPDFTPLIHLPLVETKTLEEDEKVFWNERAKLYRFAEVENGCFEWKERGTGVLKILIHTTRKCTRLVMRRDQTLKVCANHYILPQMALAPHAKSDRTWLWNTPADVSDGNPQPELLAARFRTVGIAAEFRERFNEAKSIMLEYQSKLVEVPKDETNVNFNTSGHGREKSPDSVQKETANEISGILKNVTLNDD